MTAGRFDEWGVPVEQLSSRAADRVRYAAAEEWGTVPEGLVVSQLGYPVIPEGQPVGEWGRWIPATVSRGMVRHPAWWLEESARVRWAGEDDCDYAGRIYWDLRGRGLVDEEGEPIDVLHRAGIDVADRDRDWERVRRWLTGRQDEELSGLALPAGDPAAAAERARMVRGDLEEELRSVVALDLEHVAVQVVDAMDRFAGSTPAGICQPLVDALEEGDREEITSAVAEIVESLRAATTYLQVLTETLGDPDPAPFDDEPLGDLLVGYLNADGGRAGRRAGRALQDASLSAAARVCEAGNLASWRLDTWDPQAGQKTDPGAGGAPAGGLTVAQVWGPPSEHTTRS